MPDIRYRVLAVCAHPVPYMSPLLRRMAKHPLLDLRVAYCSLRGAVEASDDPEFGAPVQWDIPLLDGYSWVEIPKRGSGGGFFGLYNPGLWKLIRTGHFDAVFCYVGYIHASFGSRSPRVVPAALQSSSAPMPPAYNRENPPGGRFQPKELFGLFFFHSPTRLLFRPARLTT